MGGKFFRVAGTWDSRYWYEDFCTPYSDIFPLYLLRFEANFCSVRGSGGGRQWYGFVIRWGRGSFCGFAVADIMFAGAGEFFFSNRAKT